MSRTADASIDVATERTAGGKSVTVDLKRNTIFAALEVVCAGLGIFLIYKVVVVFGGVGDVGLWSLVLATTSLARFGDLGAATGISRFIALSLERGSIDDGRAYADTAVAINGVLYGVLGLVAYPPLAYGLGYVVEGATLERARALLPYALASFFALNLTAATAGAIVGMHRTDIKGLVMSACTVGNVALSVLLVPRYGLQGLAVAQLAQSVSAALILRLIFVRLTGGRARDFLPSRANRRTLGEVIGFGLKLQASTLVAMVFEPASKVVITSFGGLETLGLYEMANRMVLQARHVIGSSLQALIPALAAATVSDPTTVRALYHRATAMTTILGSAAMVGVTLVAPLIGYLWFGRLFDITFITFAAICSAGWLGNLIGGPAYTLGVARGQVRWNLLGHIITSIVGPALAAFVGMVTGMVGIIITINIGLIVGSALSMVANCRLVGAAVWPPASEFRASFFNLPIVSSLRRRR